MKRFRKFIIPEILRLNLNKTESFFYFKVETCYEEYNHVSFKAI